MVITSMEINNKEFKKCLRGYECDEVDEFLDKVGEDYELLYKENSSLKEKVELLEERLRHYAEIEENIQKTLLLAQNAAEQSKISAQNESDLIIKKANDSAQEIINKAHNDVIKINDDYEMLKQEFLSFRTKFKHFMSAQMEIFDSLDKEFIKSYNVGRPIDTSVDDTSIRDLHLTPKEIENSIQENQDSIEEFKDEDLNAIKSFFSEEE